MLVISAHHCICTDIEAVVMKYSSNLHCNSALILIFPFIVGMLLVSLCVAQEGYDYAPPPPDVQLRPQTQGGSRPQAQPASGHAHSGDPLDWLRESVPGQISERLTKYGANTKWL